MTAVSSKKHKIIYIQELCASTEESTCKVLAGAVLALLLLPGSDTVILRIVRPKLAFRIISHPARESLPLLAIKNTTFSDFCWPLHRKK